MFMNSDDLLQFVKRALANSGYSDDSILSVSVYSFNKNGDVVFATSFRDVEDKLCAGKLFVRWNVVTNKWNAEY